MIEDLSLKTLHDVLRADVLMLLEKKAITFKDGSWERKEGFKGWSSGDQALLSEIHRVVAELKRRNALGGPQVAGDLLMQLDPTDDLSDRDLQA